MLTKSYRSQYLESAVQVRGFWGQLEAATNERQQAMFRMLNAHLKHLAQRIEAAVGEILEVTHTLVLQQPLILGPMILYMLQ